MNNHSDETFSSTPIYKTNIDPYQKQIFFYENPTCTYSRFPVLPKTFVTNNDLENVFYFSEKKNNTGNYFLYTQAYPSFPRVPCMFPQ